MNTSHRQAAVSPAFTRYPFALLTAAGVLVSGGVGTAQTTRNYRVVALQGWETPSIGPTAAYGVLNVEPRIGQSGHVVFGGFVANHGMNDYAIWTGLPGSISTLAVKNDPAPGRPGESLDVFHKSSGAPYWVCPDGSVAFEARVAPSNQEGVWMGMPGNLRDVAIVGNPAPGIPEAVFKSFPGLVFQANGNGDVALRGFFEGSGITVGNDSAVWTGKVGDLALIAREGSQVAGLEPGVVFNHLDSIALSLNAQGQLCLVAGVSAHPLAQNTSIFFGDRSGLFQILQHGQSIAGFPGFSWDTFGKPRLNHDGTILFEATPLPGGNRSFFTRHKDGTIRLIAEESVAAPGAGGLTWAGFVFANPAVAGNDFAVLGAGLNPVSTFAQDGIWFSSGGATHLVAREGDAASGLPGQTFAVFASGNQGPAANRNGSVVFQAATNAGVHGIWCWRQGDLQLLLAVGDYVKIGPGDSRRVSAFSVKLGSGGQSGIASGLNDRGQLVVRTSFNTGALGTAVLLINDIEDRDGDGTESLLEEAFGGNPDDPADGKVPRAELRRDGSVLRLVFRRRTDGVFQYLPQTSGDPAIAASWENLNETPQLASDQSGLPSGVERVEVPVLAGASHQFFRGAGGPGIALMPDSRHFRLAVDRATGGKHRLPRTPRDWSRALRRWAQFFRFLSGLFRTSVS